jgi:hypothetical protein
MQALGFMLQPNLRLEMFSSFKPIRRITMFLKLTQRVGALASLMALGMLTVDGVVRTSPSSAETVVPCACVQSEAQPQNGQKARSSGNFSTQGCSTTLYWQIPQGVSVDIKQDVSGGKDPTHFRVQMGARTQNPNQRSLYIANPRGAQAGFMACATSVVR